MDYLSHILIVVFFAIYFFAGKSRMHRLFLRLENSFPHSHFRKTLSVNFYFSLLLISVSVFVLFCYSFSSRIYTFLYPIKSLDIGIINAIGQLIIKLSVLWLLVTSLQISKNLDEEFRQISFSKAQRIELISFFSVILLTFGVFVYVSTLVSALLFLSSLYLYIVLRANQV